MGKRSPYVYRERQAISRFWKIFRWLASARKFILESGRLVRIADRWSGGECVCPVSAVAAAYASKPLDTYRLHAGMANDKSGLKLPHRFVNQIVQAADHRVAVCLGDTASYRKKMFKLMGRKKGL